MDFYSSKGEKRLVLKVNGWLSIVNFAAQINSQSKSAQENSLRSRFTIEHSQLKKIIIDNSPKMPKFVRF